MSQAKIMHRPPLNMAGRPAAPGRAAAAAPQKRKPALASAEEDDAGADGHSEPAPGVADAVDVDQDGGDAGAAPGDEGEEGGDAAPAPVAAPAKRFKPAPAPATAARQRAGAPAPPGRGAGKARASAAAAAVAGAGAEEDDLDAQPLPDDPKAAEREQKRREQIRATRKLREQVQPQEARHINVQSRSNAAPAVKLRDLKVELCTIGDNAKKPKADQAMYYFDSRYKGMIGPTIQVEGRLTHTPMLSEFGTVEYSVELEEKEQEILEAWSRQFEAQFRKTALERKWKVVGDAKILAKIKYKDFLQRQNAMDAEVRSRYPTVDNLPDDMIDPQTGERIKCYPSRFKATLMMKKNEVETDVLDENDMQLNPFDFKKGNKVRMAVRMGYGYYKAVTGSTEFGLPRKLVIIKRLDTEEQESGHANRTRWAAEESEDQDMPPSTSTVTTATTRSTSPDAAASGASSGAGASTPATASVFDGTSSTGAGAGGAAAASYRQRIMQQATLGVTPASGSSAAGGGAPAMPAAGGVAPSGGSVANPAASATASSSAPAGASSSSSTVSAAAAATAATTTKPTATAPTAPAAAASTPAPTPAPAPKKA